MKLIASRANERFKALRALATDAREHRRSQRCLIDGSHLVAAYREKCGLPECVVLSEHGLAQTEIKALVDALSADARVDFLLLKDSLFETLSQLANPAGIMALVRIPDVQPAMVAGASCLLLDSIQDAGNVGAILRSAAAAGIRDVFLGPGCASAWMPRVLRAAQGAHFDLALREQADLRRVAEHYRGSVVAATARAGENLFQLDLRGPIAWLFGNEGAGIAPSLLAAAPHRASIPMAAGSESLNVAAAATVCLFEELRQKQLAGAGKR